MAKKRTTAKGAAKRGVKGQTKKRSNGSDKTASPEPAPTSRPSSLIDTRVIYCGDCLEKLRDLPAACEPAPEAVGPPGKPHTSVRPPAGVLAKAVATSFVACSVEQPVWVECEAVAPRVEQPGDSVLPYRSPFRA